MITKEQIEEVEKLQRIDKEIKLLEKDYSDLKHKIGYIKNKGLLRGEEFTQFSYDYRKYVRIAIKTRIKILKEKREKLING